MQIYFAARYSRRIELWPYRQQLERAGHAVTARWMLGNHELPIGATPTEAAQLGLRLAQEDLEDLRVG